MQSFRWMPLANSACPAVLLLHTRDQRPWRPDRRYWAPSATTSIGTRPPLRQRALPLVPLAPALSTGDPSLSASEARKWESKGVLRNQWATSGRWMICAASDVGNCERSPRQWSSPKSRRTAGVWR
jgi:hypothetical protein